MWSLRVFLLLQLCLWANLASANQRDGSLGETLQETILRPVNIVATDVIPPLFFNQTAADINGTNSKNREKILHDFTNENAGTFTAQQLIGRSGFLYEDHFVLADDGYITNLIHIINPKADKSQLKQPPVFIMHGGIIDPTAWVWASTLSHWPEDYPRKLGQPMTSSNRSLALMLANNGYDVWLVGSRGCNLMNQGHVRLRVFQPLGKTNQEKLTQFKVDLMRSKDLVKYFDYSMDEIMKYEVPRQIEKVLELTGAESVIFFSFSFSTMIAFPLFALHPEIARRVHQHIALAPIINNKGASIPIQVGHQLVPKIPYKTGVMLNDMFFTHNFPNMFTAWTSNLHSRYTFGKIAQNWLAGPSAKFTTKTEAPVIWHLLVSTGFKEVQHYCQQVNAGNLQRFDYGPMFNMFLYKSPKPPRYDIRVGNVKKWMLIEGTLDNLATPKSAQQIYDTVLPKPLKRLQINGYNHLDLVAGMDNDFRVNLPILEFLDEYKLPPLKSMTEQQLGIKQKALSEDLNLSKYVPGVHIAHADGLTGNWV